MKDSTFNSAATLLEIDEPRLTPSLNLKFRTDRDLIKFLAYLRTKQVNLRFPGLNILASEICSEETNSRTSLKQFKEMD